MAASHEVTLPAITAESTQPRKRRKRTAGGGAQDDCFACRKRGATCDRKRPYCTQCLDIGKECSGYKTTLTWGVGVASRGKLRGLTLPVAKTSETASQSQTISRRKSSVSKKPADLSTRAQTNLPKPAPAILIPQRHPPTSYPLPEMHSLGSWSATSSYPSTSPDFNHFDLSSHPSLKHIQTSLPLQYDNFPSSASSTGSFAEADFTSSIEFPSSVPYPTEYHQSFNSFLDTTIDPISPTTAEIDDHLGPSLEADLSINNYDDTGMFHQQNNVDFGSSLAQLSNIEEDALLHEDKMLPMLDTRFGNHLFHLPPRIQALISYYDTRICPFLVAFDGPQNPYRMHIIQLAASNEGLQHALAALAANNIRMRRKEVRQMDYTEDSPRFDSSDALEPSPEESHFKQSSIEQLNMQLTHLSAAQDDSVLATLLILCLFHVCDSGFSKFKTQLAGVQKLLSLRDPNTKSAFTGWVEMFFMWFDVMTAAVNDRESQIRSESLDMLDYSANLGALEQFSGCDGRLFKLIARLGSLSLLAQGRPVARTHPKPMRKVRLQRPMYKSKRSLNAADYENIDGNGWGFAISTADDGVDNGLEGINTDDRAEFWSEWQDIRSRLQTWAWDADNANMPTAALMSSFGNGLTQEQTDLIHISESFRHSALLYTERLAFPLLPSSAATFQKHVSQALSHITALPITSCVNKFLLWPLFITGTECVDPGHRAVIKSRCIEIQRESGFFNNISSLELLEKVWADGDMSNGEEGEIHARRRDSEVTAGSESRQAFRWRRAMDRVDGEYLII